MATHRKTIEAAYDTLRSAITTVTDAAGAPTYTSLGTITLKLPENTSRVFRSVYLELYLMDDSATAITLTGMRTGLSFGGGSFVDQTRYAPGIANTGDHQSVCWLQDVTSAFTSNYGSGTSQTIELHFCAETSAGASSVCNVGAKLIVTYEADYASQDTRAKTIRIPLSSPTGDLTTTLAELGTNQVPQLTGSGGLLDTVLATVTFEQIWFEISYNEGNSGTTAAQLEVQLDSATAVADASHKQDLNTGRWVREFWRQDSMTTTAVHAFKARSTQTTMKVNNLQVLLCCTITYSETSSAKSFQSLRLIGEPATYGLGGTTSTDPTARRLSLLIPEASPVLKQSAVVWTWMEAGRGATLGLKVGAQSAYTSYTGTSSSSEAGMNGVVHRIDSGGPGGSAITLAQGVNDFDLFAFSNQGGSVVYAGITPCLVLNYSCDKPAAGGDAGNRSVAEYTGRVSTSANPRLSIGTVPLMTEPAGADYYVSNFAIEVYFSSTGSVAICEAKRASGENPVGFFPIAQFNWLTDGERSVFIAMSSLTRRTFRRWKGDPDPERIDLYASRLLHVAGTGSSAPLPMGVVGWQTYHTLTWAVAALDADITGASGDPAGTVVTVHDATTGEPLRTGVMNAGGDYSINWYDPRSVFTQAQQDSTHQARSPNQAAGS